MRAPRTTLYYYDHTDIFRHLAAEASWFDATDTDTRVIYVWRADNAIVIGKNQNPWKECDVAALRADGVPLARRLSGGGTVFHDLGNLNFAFIGRRADCGFDEQIATIMAFIESLGCKPALGPHRSIYANGKKCSGNALRLRRDITLHHGTLLIASDLRKMKRYLTPAVPGISGHSVPSKPAAVVNLADLASGLTIASATDRLIEHIADTVPGIHRVVRAPCPPNSAAFDARHETLQSWDWVYGRTPAFDATWRRPFAGENYEINLGVSRGIIGDARIEGRGSPVAGRAIAALLRGCRLEATAIRERLQELIKTDSTEPATIDMINQISSLRGL